MLKKILSQDSCAKCRVCCGFVESDKWEIPLIFSELKQRIEKEFPWKLTKRGNEYVFDMEFCGDKVVYCPALTENGCALGGDKPFDCMIWPFRVNDFNGTRVITVSPVCETVSALPLSQLSAFVNGEFAEAIFEQARLHPDMVKPYIDGYPILAIENNTKM